MKHFALRVTAESPLAIRADHAPAGAAGARYIPGTTLLGGLASLHRLLYRKPEEVEMFAPLFLNDQVYYPDLYPAIFDDSGLQGRQTPVLPLPKTVQSCKRHSGFRFPYDKVENDAHGVRDTLIDWVLTKLAPDGSQGDRQRLHIIRGGQQCTCGEALDRFDGYYRRSDINPSNISQALPDRYNRLQTRTGIDRDAGTVQEGILYNRQVFEEGMQFWGHISIHEHDDLVRHFQKFIREIGSSGLLHLGTGRTRGMGKVTLAATPFKEDQLSFAAFTSRLTAFNDLLRQRANELDIPLHRDAYFFALTLHSPLLLCDELLRYQSVITPAALKEYDRTLPEVNLIFYASEMQRITGWQELWGTPRASELAIESGSVFVFASAAPPNEHQLQALYALEEQGMGKRRAEGFGRIGLSDSIHQHIKQEEEQPV